MVLTIGMIGIWEDFNKPKIAWASVGATEYALIPSEFCLLDTNYFFTTSFSQYLISLLNSELITWWINSEDTPIGNGGAYRHYKYNIEKLCIPLTRDDVTISNEQVYTLYDLSQPEIDYIKLQSKGGF